MISLLKKLFGAKPAEQTVATPYKVEAIPAGTETSIIAVSHSDLPVVVPEAVIPAAVVEQAPAKKSAPKKSQAVKKPVATKTATPKAAPKPKAKPAV